MPGGEALTSHRLEVLHGRARTSHEDLVDRGDQRGAESAHSHRQGLRPAPSQIQDDAADQGDGEDDVSAPDEREEVRRLDLRRTSVRSDVVNDPQVRPRERGAADRTEPAPDQDEADEREQ